MPKVYIDKTEYDAPQGKNMLEVALDNGLDLPYFCWHPAMGSVGSCRLCAVRVYKDEHDTRGKIQMACMTPALEGTRISMTDHEATEFRRYVIEWLMVNHPHDCPVCDEGGHCHLQDMTTMCGQVYRRYRFPKRTYYNQYLGPFINHEMNRCIQCYRCVRFYKDLAGGQDLNVFASKNRVYFGREQDGVLQSEFSGNLVEVCPTGVFTDKTWQHHYTRKWDLETAPSVCIHCGVGCNTIPGARYNKLRRIASRFNGDVNGYFLCDRGRFGYEFVNSDQRIRQAEVDKTPTTWDSAMARAREMIASANGVVGIGSPRMSIEANYALKKLVGDANFSTGLSDFGQQSLDAALDVLRDGTARTPSLGEVEDTDVVLILGADPTNEAPMLDFAIRQAMRKAPLDIARKLKIPDWDANAVANALQNARGSLYVAAPWSIKLQEIGGEFNYSDYPGVAELAGQIQGKLSSGEQGDDLASHAARDLTQARQPLVVTSISAGADVVRAAANLAWAIKASGKDCWLKIIVPEANTMGVGMIGGISVDQALEKIETGQADTLVVMQNDLHRRVNSDQLQRALDKAKGVIVLDCIRTQLAEAADVLLPVNAYVETDGTFVNNEGRAQRFFQVFIPLGEMNADWYAAQELGGEIKWPHYEDVLRDIAANLPELAPALDAAEHADWRDAAGQKVPRMPQRYSGRTAMRANVDVREHRPPGDPQTPLAFTMEGLQNPPPPPLIQRFWWPGWNSPSAINKFQIEVGGPLHGGNPGVRLIEPGGTKTSIDLAAPPRLAEDEVWIVPRPRIFGSEGLSRLAPGIAELTPEAAASMRPELGKSLGLSDGQVFEFNLEGWKVSLPVRLDESMVADVVSVPAFFPETMGILGPVKVRLKRAK